jgi:recombination protein RecR
MFRLPSFDKLVHELGKMPGIGPKTAQRLAYHLLRTDPQDLESLRDALRLIRENIRECPTCFSYTENEGSCALCLDTQRDDHILCVVEDPGSIHRLESAGVFKGRYHVLHGALSPLDGITPNDLRIKPLVQRIELGLSGHSPRIEELILALDADLEGDTTVLYIAKILREKGVRLSRIAHGVPIGGDIDFIDHRTLGRALENRVSV